LDLSGFEAGRRHPSRHALQVPERLCSLQENVAPVATPAGAAAPQPAAIPGKSKSKKKKAAAAAEGAGPVADQHVAASHEVPVAAHAAPLRASPTAGAVTTGAPKATKKKKEKAASKATAPAPARIATVHSVTAQVSTGQRHLAFRPTNASATRRGLVAMEVTQPD
jgi:hypothetical protein